MTPISQERIDLKREELLESDYCPTHPDNYWQALKLMPDKTQDKIVELLRDGKYHDAGKMQWKHVKEYWETEAEEAAESHCRADDIYDAKMAEDQHAD